LGCQDKRENFLLYIQQDGIQLNKHNNESLMIILGLELGMGLVMVLGMVRGKGMEWEWEMEMRKGLKLG